MNRYNLLCLVSIIIAFTSCEADRKKTNISTPQLSIFLTDAPAEYEAVLIDLQDVMIKFDGDSTVWEHLENIAPGIYNLLELTGGVDTLIARSEVDTGIIAEIRLILGSENSLVMAGDTIPLKTPSAQQSGLKIKINEELEGGAEYKILLDFDASKSIVKAGNSGKYLLKPVIRAIFEEIVPVTGKIKGQIADSINAVMYAVHNSDSVGTYPDTTGTFLLQGLPEAVYSVYIEPEEGWKDTTITNVEVVAGTVNDLGFIELSEGNN